MTEGKELRTVAKIFYQSSVFFVRWLMLAAVVGSIVGVMGVLFHFSVEKATELRTEFPWLLYLLPLGSADCFAVSKSGMAKDMGTNTIIEAVRGGASVADAYSTADLYQYRYHPPVGRLFGQRRRSIADWRQHGSKTC